jgi:uncharacterized protein (DUF1330 family)
LRPAPAGSIAAFVPADLWVVGQFELWQKKWPNLISTAGVYLQTNRESCMKTITKMALTLLTGVALGAAAIQGLHAQAKPPVYHILEIDVTNPEGYTKEFVPKVQALIKASGGRNLSAGGEVTTIEGEPQKSRVVVEQWESMEKIQAWRNSAEYKEIRKIGDKYAKFRSFAVEGLAN